MSCSLIKVDKYIFEWETSRNDRAEVGQYKEKGLFYAGVEKETSWCLKLYSNGDSYQHRNYISCRLVIMSGFPVTATCAFKVMKGKEVLVETIPLPKYFSAKSDYVGLPDLMKKGDLNFTFRLCAELKITETKNTLLYRRSIEDVNSLVLDISSLLENEDTKDLSLVPKEGKVFRAHKIILIARSEVFAAMFQHDMQENLSSQVNIEDVDEESLKETLLYCYSGNLSTWNYSLAKNMFVVGDKYKISGLKEKCSTFLESNLNIEIVTEILVLADMHTDENLKNECTMFIAKNAEDVLETHGWVILFEKHSHLVNEVMRVMSKFCKNKQDS